MYYEKIKKLLLAAFVLAVIFLSFSVCAFGAGIESLSAEGGVLRASVSGENAALYAVRYNGAILADVFFSEADSSGNIEMNIGDGEGYSLYLWNKVTLSPLSLPYSLKDGRAYAEGSSDPVPSYASYTFDQDVNVVIVSSVSDTLIKGYQAGVEKSFPLASSVTVLGLSDKFEDIVPGCVILPSVPVNGEYNAVELLASIGIPVDPNIFLNSMGSYAPSDGSAAYKNILSKFYQSGGIMGIFVFDDSSFSTKTKYTFENISSKVHRVGIAIDEDGNVVVSLTSQKIYSTDYPFPSTYEYNNYVYLRYRESDSRVTEAVLYCVPTNFNPGAGDGEYSDIWSSGNRVIIE